MTTQKPDRTDPAQVSGPLRNPDQKSSQSDSADRDRILAAVAEHDGAFVGDSRNHMWGWDLTGMWEKYGRVGLSAKFGSDGRLEDAMITWGHTVVGLIQSEAFNDAGDKIDNPRDTSGNLHRVLAWIENIETILGQPSEAAAGYYVRALEGPDHRHAWIFWDADEQIAHCTDWFCQATFFPASGVLGAGADS